MLNSILARVASTSSISLNEFIICSTVSVVLGIVLSLVHSYKNKTSLNFSLTLILLPLIVQSVIMVVNGNLGTGVAVAGAFSLVRFRSMPGTSREIASIFISMGMGLANGMGYVGISCILLLMVCIITLIISYIQSKAINDRELKITIAENMDYDTAFDEVFNKYTKRAELQKVRTINMGSLYELHYLITQKNVSKEKAMLDDIRIRNGNLNITCAKPGVENMQL